ncbi:MAG: hypothetical protein AB1758_10830 [Candidatus Eremiobacterota bacterium]
MRTSVSLLAGTLVGLVTAVAIGAIAWLVIRGLAGRPLLAGAINFPLSLLLGYGSNRLFQRVMPVVAASNTQARTLVGVAIIGVLLPPADALLGLSFLPGALGAVLGAVRFARRQG